MRREHTLREEGSDALKRVVRSGSSSKWAAATARARRARWMRSAAHVSRSGGRWDDGSGGACSCVSRSNVRCEQQLRA